MPYRDKERQKTYQREWQRSRKAGVPMKPLVRTLNSVEIKTAEGMLNVLSDILSQLMDAKADLFMKARTIAYVVNVGLRAVEVAELERRLMELENRMGGSENERL